MTWVGLVCTMVLGAAGALTLYRLVKGPTTLNRTVALDVIVAISVCAMAVEAAVNLHTTTLPLLLVLSLLGFVGSVSVARFAAREDASEGGPR
jgi:multicomponent Na+:H+ antiporter subunit F